MTAKAQSGAGPCCPQISITTIKPGAAKICAQSRLPGNSHAAASGSTSEMRAPIPITMRRLRLMANGLLVKLAAGSAASRLGGDTSGIGHLGPHLPVHRDEARRLLDPAQPGADGGEGGKVVVAA